MKSPWASKTLWFNALGAVAATAGILAEHIETLRPLVPDHYFPALVAVVTVGNALLRTITNQPIARRRKRRPVKDIPDDPPPQDL